MVEVAEASVETPEVPVSTDVGRSQKMLVSFESGHYKTINGCWKGDSQWTHWIKSNGKQIHINKNKVEYYEEV